MDQSLRRAVVEVTLSTLFYALFCLIAMAVVAVFVRAYVPSAGVVSAVSWVVKCAGSFLMPLIFIRRGRALVKGIVAGVAGSLDTMLIFAAVGGGFSLTALYLAELAACAALGALGALVGTKLRRE